MMRTTTPLRIALVGAGVIGKRHIQEIAACDDARLVGIADPSPAGQAQAQALGVPWLAEPEALFDSERPEAAIVCTPNALHLPVGLACVARGIPMLMEKPIADTLPAALALAGAAAEAGVPLLVGHHRRHNPMVRRTREMVRGGAIGRLVVANIMCLLTKPAAYFDAPWRREPGGGPILINLIHEVDLVRHICGEIASVQAFSSSAARGFAVEDSCACVLRLADGGLANISLSDSAASPWSWDTAAGEDRALFDYRKVPTHFFAGSDGACSMPDMTHWFYRGEKSRHAPIQDEAMAVADENTYANQLRHFIAAARREVEPLLGGFDAARTLAATLAVQQSALSGARIDLD